MHPTGMVSLFLPLAEPFPDGVRPSARALCKETFSSVIHSPSPSSSPVGSSYNGGGVEDGTSAWGGSDSSGDGGADSSGAMEVCPWLSPSSRGTSSMSRRSRACSRGSTASSPASVPPRVFRSSSKLFSSMLSVCFSSSEGMVSSVTFCIDPSGAGLVNEVG
jgi:hypothetical protein